MTILTSSSAILDSGFDLAWVVVVEVEGVVVVVVDGMALVDGMPITKMLSFAFKIRAHMYNSRIFKLIQKFTMCQKVSLYYILH